MSQAVYKLESFSKVQPPAFDLVPREHLDDAYERGLAEGRAMARSDDLAALTQAMAALDGGLRDALQLRREASRQAIAELLPVIAVIVSTLARKGEAAGLEAALLQELRQLAEATPAQDWHITCAPALEAMIRRCAETAGLTGLDLRVSESAQGASIILADGHSAFSNQEVARHFHDLISELQESFR